MANAYQLSQSPIKRGFSASTPPGTTRNGIHRAQLRTYMKLSKTFVGLLMNFNVKKLTNGAPNVLGYNSNSHAGFYHPSPLVTREQ